MVGQNDPWSSYGGQTNNTGTILSNNNNTNTTKIPFGSRWRNRIGRRSAPQGHNDEKSKPQLSKSNLSSQYDNVPNPLFAKYEKSRASKVSVTVVKPAKDSRWGIGFKVNSDGDDDQIVRIKALTKDGLLRYAPFQEGDILKTVNNQPCKNDEKTIKKLTGYDAGIPITLIAEAARGNSKLVQAVIKKPLPDSLVGIGFYNIQHDGSSLLIINHLDPSGLFAYSSLSQGDLILSINGVSCSQLMSEEASEVLKDSGKRVVNILAMRSSALQDELNPSRLALMRRAIVGAFWGSTVVRENSKDDFDQPLDGDGPSSEIAADDTYLTLTQTESGSTNQGSTLGGNSQFSATELSALDMIHDTPMDDTVSELSFTETRDLEISEVFSSELDDIMLS